MLLVMKQNCQKPKEQFTEAEEQKNKNRKSPARSDPLRTKKNRLHFRFPKEHFIGRRGNLSPELGLFNRARYLRRAMVVLVDCHWAHQFEKSRSRTDVIPGESSMRKGITMSSRLACFFQPGEGAVFVAEHGVQ